MPARPDETLDYTGIWKVSSDPCSVSGTVTIGHDPQEIAPKITMPTGSTLAGGSPSCAPSTATCTTSTACTPACTGTDKCCLPGLCSDETEVLFSCEATLKLSLSVCPFVMLFQFMYQES